MSWHNPNRAAKQQDSDLAPDSRRAPSGVYERLPSQYGRLCGGKLLCGSKSWAGL
jgi:hypothetical protein